MLPTGREVAEVTDGTAILMDYSNLSYCNYLYLSSELIEPLGYSLADSILKLNVSLDRITLVGHSLGEIFFIYFCIVIYCTFSNLLVRDV